LVSKQAQKRTQSAVTESSYKESKGKKKLRELRYSKGVKKRPNNYKLEIDP
jgi:hypothetical protein